MRALSILLVAFLGACTRDAGPAGDAAAASMAAAVRDTRTAAALPATAPAGKAPPAVAGAREVVNPDNNTVVFLYYRLAGLTPPLDSWIEEDSRVKFAAPVDRAAKRAAVRAEFEAAAASVRDIGALRLTTSANLSDYDPSYGEFSVRALAPSSQLTFAALGQKVAVSFRNGETAQIWRVPQAEAQAIRDKVSVAGDIELDVLLRIAGVLPGPGGGTITTDIVSYEMRGARSGATLARMQISP